MIESQHELDVDGIDLTGNTDYGGIKFHALGEGSTLGNPQPVDRSLASALLDGSVVVTDRHDNREPRFQVQIEAADSAMLDVGQGMLFRACNKPTTLGWKPPDGYGERRIYRVLTAHLERIFNDLEELPGRRTVRRTYALRLICHPWAYATEPTTVVAVAEAPETPVTLTLSDGSSATGWSSPSTAVAQPVVASGAIKVAPREPSPDSKRVYPHVSEATLALSAVDFSATKYVTMDLKPVHVSMEFRPIPENVVATTRARVDYGHSPESPYAWFAAYVDGNKLPMLHYVAIPGRGYRVTWVCNDTSASSLRVLAGTDVRGWPNFDGDEAADPNRGFTIDNVKRSNVAPGHSSTGKQRLLTTQYDGSARTTASIEISHPTRGLGETVIYTSPDLGRQGYEPSCKAHMATGGHTVVPDTEAVSGSWVRCSDLAPGIWNIPAAGLPQGAYGVRIRMRWRIPGAVSSSAFDHGRVTTTVASVVNGETLFTTELPVRPTLLRLSPRHNYGTSEEPVTPAEQPPLSIMTLGVVHLPPNEVASDDPTAFVRITASMSTTDQFEVDDLWIYYLGEGSSYSHVFCGEETPIVGQVIGDPTLVLGSVHNHLFIDQPNPTNFKPRLCVGTQPDRSDAFNPGWPTIKAFGDHPIHPGANRFHIIATGAPYFTAKHTITEANF